MTNTRSGSGGTPGSLTTVISAIGGLLLLWSILEPIGLFASGSSTIFQARYVVGYVTIVPSCVGMMWAGRWLRRSDLPAAYHRKIAAYWLLGGGGFLAFNVGLMTFFPAESVWIVTNWIRWALSLGLAVGLFVGTAQSRAIYHTIASERQSLRAEHVERQRDLVDHMNGILRHEVLNATQVILGNASSLQDADEPIQPTDERLDRIYRYGEEVTTVIQEVRSLLEAMQGDRELTAIRLADVIRTEARKVTDRHPDVDVDVRVPEDLSIEGDDMVGRIFGNLVSNAAEHNGPGVRISVDGETAGGTAVVTVRDDGDGIPEQKLDGLFDRPRQGDHGLGLYLVRELAESYGGTVELVDTGDAGTVFEVRLPTPGAAPEERPARAG